MASHAVLHGEPGDELAASITRQLEADIVFGRLKPGHKLREEELADRFSASRHHVREALARLERRGIVTKARNKGFSVRSFSVEEVGEIYEIREMIQRQAALRITLPVPRPTIARLEAVQARYEQAIAHGDFAAIHLCNERFHSALFRLCGSDMLADLVKQYMDLSYVIRANAFNAEHLSVAQSEHRLMLSLLGTRDAWALSQLCVDHIQYSKKQYLAFLERQDLDLTGESS